jgi:hypothetical protein
MQDLLEKVLFIIGIDPIWDSEEKDIVDKSLDLHWSFA